MKEAFSSIQVEDNLELTGDGDDAFPSKPTLDLNCICTKMTIGAVGETDMRSQGDDDSPREDIALDLDRSTHPTRLQVRPAKYKDFQTRFRPK